MTDIRDYGGCYCGCCGLLTHLPVSLMPWCGECKKHIGDANLPVWERSYFAQHRKPCPVQVKAQQAIAAKEQNGL